MWIMEVWNLGKIIWVIFKCGLWKCEFKENNLHDIFECGLWSMEGGQI
jgi:hypothetical protein